MTLSLSDVFPNTAASLQGSAFIFGAGSSFEAGYPMMDQLTRSVMGALSPGERALIDEVLGAVGETYIQKTAQPNIEQLADLLIAHGINSGDPKFKILEERLRALIIETILSVQDPKLDHHCRFFEALKKRAFGRPCSVWVLTTNYDLLFETAAAHCGVTIENGFSGTTERYFNLKQFELIAGTIRNTRFEPDPSLTVKLIKLHGSVSWSEHNNQFFEKHPAAINHPERRVMILPRRKKVMDALAAPYNALFGLASRIIGSNCKYIASCGFSFSDEHINENILLPPLRENRCRLFAFCKEEPVSLSSFKSLPNFFGGYESHLHQHGATTAGSTDYWRFSKFVELFE